MSILEQIGSLALFMCIGSVLIGLITLLCNVINSIWTTKDMVYDQAHRMITANTNLDNVNRNLLSLKTDLLEIKQAIEDMNSEGEVAEESTK